MQNPHHRYGFQWHNLLDGNWRIDDTLQESTRYMRIVVRIVNTIGFALERHGIEPERFREAPFPEFSYLVESTAAGLVIALGRGPSYSVRYAVYQETPREVARNLDAIQTHIRQDMPWDNFLFFRLPADILRLPDDESTRVIESEVEQVIGQFIAELESAGKSEQEQSGDLRPIAIFPPGPFRTNERLCFVLMPFKGELKNVYDVGIKPAIEGIGLDCRRADDITASGDVLAQIYQHLRTARVVVADLTGANGNVLYELGLAHMMGHQVILLTQTMSDVPFDLRQQRHIVYEQSIEGVNKLRGSLNKALAAAIQERSNGAV